jgi:N-acetylglucosaminyldiphosphoundecaprenol N-acetyl-beta-D-mannosaminyltransferase
VTVLDCPIDVLDMQATISRCVELIEAEKPAQHVVVNAAKLVAFQEDHRMAAIIRGCDLVNADGQAVVWASRLLRKPLPERVAGIDLMHELIKEAERRNLGVYFLGARQNVLDQAIERFKDDHPRLRVVGSHHGWFSDLESDEVIEDIRAAEPHILFVAMSSPRKEYWLAENLEASGASFAMGVGGALDVVAGLTKRAPRWMQRTGLEWFFRLIQEPGRLWRRYLRTNFRFTMLLMREFVSRR